MNVRTLMANAVFLVLPALLAACSDASRPPAVSFKIQNVPPVPRTMSQMSREVHISRDFMSPRSRARRASHSMHPRFITIHSTANPTGDAAAHARALKRGAMGSLNWHFTVDQYRAIQHIPLNETGRHADRGGPGDMYSIGIEMGGGEEPQPHRHLEPFRQADGGAPLLLDGQELPGPAADQRPPGA